MVNTTPALELYHALFETAPDAMIVAARDGRIVLANPQAARLFGYDAVADLVGAPVEALMPPDVHDAHRGHRTRYMDAPRVRPMGAGQELIGQRRDGSQFPVEIALSPIRTSTASYFVASIRDISETQRARQALARAHYDTALAQASRLALESPLETTLERVPPLLVPALGIDAAVVVFGHATRTELAVRAAHGVAPSELDPVLDAMAAAMVAGTQYGMLQLASGGAFASGHAVLLFDLAQPLGALVALSRAPRALDRDAQHFLQQVADVLASAILRHRTQEQLAHAQRLDAVGQLTGGIAHDFNNLLTVVSGNLQLLESHVPSDGEAGDVIASALRAVGRGAELTRKLLAFARRQRLTPRATTPQQLLGDVGLMLRRTLGEQVDVVIRCADDVGAVFADPAQLDTALVNLALNARDAMPRGGRLEITVRRERVAAGEESHADARPGDYVVFAVADTGLGMSAEVQARAFEPFFTTKEHGKGSGLGLSMVYGFVKQSGGHLSVDSRLGYGTRIELYLPAAAPTGLVAAAPVATIARRGHERVLVVEDEPEVRGIALAFLRSLGYACESAADAEEALVRLRADGAIDVLFSDVVLGTGANGGELAREARRIRPALRVLLTSGYERTEAHGGEAPGAEFPLLRKPYRREELADALRRLLDTQTEG